MSASGHELFDQALGDIEGALRYVAYRRRLSPAELDELRSFVMLKLIENDYRRLRKYEGEGSMRAYLIVVVQRLYLDYKIWCFGKWHPSAEAKRRGAEAVALERLLFRDGYDIGEAVRLVASSSGAETDALFDLAHGLPVRHRPRLVSEELFERIPARTFGDPVEVRERIAFARRVQAELTRALAALDEDDRRVLSLRFREERTVPQIAEALGVEPKPLYARIRRLLRRVRLTLERNGVGAEGGRELSEATPRVLDLDGVFAAVGA